MAQRKRGCDDRAFYLIFEFVKIGRPKDQYTPLVKVYQKRLDKQIRFEHRIIKAQSGENRNFEKNLIANKSATEQLVVLDERGSLIRSQTLASKLQNWKNDGLTKKVTMVVGGPTGISPELRKAADQSWCLSGCVLPSDIAWLILWEQIYRANSILCGSPYHND